MVKSSSRHVYLGVLGSFGSIIALFQMAIFESSSILFHTTWSYDIILFLIGFVLSLFFMYSNTSVFLKQSDAALFNLSLLTSDVYAVLFSYLVYNTMVHWLYYIAFTLTLIGTYMYHFAGNTSSIQEYSSLPSLYLPSQYSLLESNRDSFSNLISSDSCKETETENNFVYAVDAIKK
jgi:solute carrier family 35 protein F1/2